MRRIGLIIQGPLLSVGKDGRAAHAKKKGMRENQMIRYNCRDNIQRIIDDFGDLFDSIVVSTWENEIESNDTWSGATVVTLPDPGEVNRDAYDHRSRNKYRQFLGIRQGVTALKEVGNIEYVVRIRTDQYLNLRTLVSALERVVSCQEPGAIYVPFVRPDDFFVHDIYLAGRVDAVAALCDAALAFDMFEFIPCVHREMVLKYAYLAYPNRIGVPGAAYFPWWPPCGASAETKRIFAFMFTHVFIPLPPEVFRTVEWRGTALNEGHIKAQYPVHQRKKNIANVPMFVSINWFRYGRFVEETRGLTSSYVFRMKARLGRVCWRIWNILRSVAAYTRVTNIVYALLRG